MNPYALCVPETVLSFHCLPKPIISIMVSSSEIAWDFLFCEKFLAAIGLGGS